MVAPHAVDTKDPAAVATLANRVFANMGGATSAPLIDRLVGDVTRMFRGQFPGLQQIDMRYHDYEHTLQATVCLLEILAGRHRSGATPALSIRDCELGLMAVLLHDSGYLKPIGDNHGTGAKFTFVHVRRSCEFAAKYLPSLGVSPEEIVDVQHVIGCTGPINRIATTPFRRPQARLLACCLVTADYLGQMSAPDYVSELPILYREFAEAYDYEQTPDEERLFHDEKELIRNTPKFWAQYVQPLLEKSTGGVYHFTDKPDGTNPYIAAVSANINEIGRQLDASRTG